MAAIVGTSTRGWNGGNDTTVASAAKSTTTGNALLVCVTTQEGAGSTTIDTVSDTALNNFVPATLYGAGGGGGQARWFVALNIAGNASNVVTATMSGNTRYKAIFQIEISGLKLTSALADESGGVALSSATINPGDLTLSGAGIFLYGVVATNDRSFTPDGAYTEIDDAQGGAWGGSGSTAYDIDAGSTDNPTATANSASNLTIAAIALLDVDSSTLGDTTAGADEFPLNTDRCIVDRFTMTDTGTVNFAQARSGPTTVAGSSWKFVILADSSGLPGSVLYVSNATSITAARRWFNFTFGSAPSLTPGDYWLGVVADSFQAYLGEDASGSAPNVQMANGTFSYATPPGTWPGSDADYGVGLNVYLDYTVSGASGMLLPASFRMQSILVR